MANLHIKGSTEIDDTGVTLDNLRNNKVDKVSGKGLSTNDFTTALKNKLNNIGTFIQDTEKTATATQGQANYIHTLSIPAGTWIVFAYWRYQANDVSSYSSIEGISTPLADSTRDTDGWVNKTSVGIHVGGATTAKLNLWPRNKTITVYSNMFALRLA